MSDFFGPRNRVQYVLSFICLLAAFGLQYLPWQGMGLHPASQIIVSLALGVAFAVLLWISEAQVPRGRRLINLAGALFILGILCFEGVGEASNTAQGILLISGFILLGVAGYSLWRSRPQAVEQ